MTYTHTALHISLLLLTLGSSCACESDSGTSEQDSAGGAGAKTPPGDDAAGVVSCGNSLDCPGAHLVCAKEEGARVGVCLECGDDTDCGETGTCVAGTCQASCSSDKDCTGLGKLCDKATAFCASCLSVDDCAVGEFCSGGECSSTLCHPGESTCVGTDVLAECNADGTGFLAPQACDTGTCRSVNGTAECTEGETTGTGGQGSATGGGSPVGSDDNLISNGNFSGGKSGWEGGTGATDTSSGKGCVYGDATIGWQGTSSGLNLEAGDYTFEFTISTSGATSVEAKVAPVNYPYEPVLFSEEITALSKTYSFEFSVADTAGGIGLAFNVASQGDEFCIDDVSLRKK